MPVIYYIVKILVTLWIILYSIVVAGLHIPFTGEGNIRDIFLFSSSLFFAGLATVILWQNELLLIK